MSEESDSPQGSPIPLYSLDDFLAEEEIIDDVLRNSLRIRKFH